MGNPVPAADTAQWQSLLRTGLKVVGTVLATIGVGDAASHAGGFDPLVDAIMGLVGSVVVAIGAFKSYWHHAP